LFFLIEELELKEGKKTGEQMNKNISIPNPFSVIGNIRPEVKCVLIFATDNSK